MYLYSVTESAVTQRRWYNINERKIPKTWGEKYIKERHTTLYSAEYNEQQRQSKQDVFNPFFLDHQQILNYSTYC